jgi:hypothetical protein
MHNDKIMAGEQDLNFHENVTELFIVQAIKMYGLVEI